MNELSYIIDEPFYKIKVLFPSSDKKTSLILFYNIAEELIGVIKLEGNQKRKKIINRITNKIKSLFEIELDIHENPSFVHMLSLRQYTSDIPI